jgi:pyrimidine deaminase RibD-like protein
MKPSDFQIYDHEKLDKILVELCQLIIDGQKINSNLYGMVGAAVLDNDNNLVKSTSYKTKGKFVHAERAAIDKYEKNYGPLSSGSIIITTLSPCSKSMDDRYSDSCTSLINDSPIKKVYSGYSDPTQDNSESYKHKKFHIQTTKNKQILELCKTFADTFLKESLLEVNPNTLSGSEGPGLNECRTYLLEQLKKIKTEFDTIYILGSWYGNLSMMIENDNDFNFDRIINVESDKEALETGQEVIDKLNYKFIYGMYKDANTLTYQELGNNGLVINTSCNNIDGTDWFANIPDNTMCILSARNNDEGAINKFNSTIDLLEKYPLNNILYAGKKEFMDPETKYDYYLVIGTK